MQIELDDADTNWARPGVYQVADRVFRIPLPLPHAGLRAVNAYALADDGGLVWVTVAGWPEYVPVPVGPWHQPVAAASPLTALWRKILSRLWQAASSRHSPRAASLPRRSRSRPFWQVMIWPKTGSTMALRRR